ncbi:MAG: hypothetical protein CO186_08205 [Zetaproteobacteria bacterium CG_4_9_14_3_um_filter_49_83]|nr:MAG: hypothetical protein AUJ56_08415 [Zetaproteobacteria bacterium CG1_02_49_23]PIQ34052.1 MAG: hypothetical protein COW62_03135 [Zetaproteobacteria bacterium CG17_big_fil_post_rev_8_21_14_2_50_50_13]PIY55900.1 MAG: hypothetical protein COZ00_07205 [Zetaproteobacteria bacterium CG_4_10_14_0_8_um_filter_49_80]PJA35030.1 MAG: hypothetical protein CO186_08205 [Zetaproteobacteria bacterium CG_4_9_14_3_um_filter_49_83]
MKQEHILSVLYDLTIVIGGENKVEPLVSKFIQKLMFHTGYSVGIYFSLQSSDKEPEQQTYRITSMIGGNASLPKIGYVISFPAEFAQRVLVNPDLSDFCAGCSLTRNSIWLPAAHEGGVLLLAPEVLTPEMPVTQMFYPVMRNFAKAIRLCRINEDHLAELKNEVQQATETIRAEKNKFLQLLLSMPDAVYITDNRGIIEIANPGTEDVFGYTIDEILGHSVEELVPENNRAGHAAQVENYLRSPVSRTMAEGRRLSARKKNGEIFPVSISLNPVMVGTEQKVIVSVRDMTEYENLMRQFQQAQKMEALGTLIGGFAHDFNNLLTSITANTFFAKELVSDNKKAVELIDSIEQRGFDAAEMIRQLLAFSRNEEIKMKEVQLTALVRESLKLHSTAIPSFIEFNTEITNDDLCINGNPIQLQQVLLNLLNNARDAVLDAAKKEIRLTLQPIEANANLRKHNPKFTFPHYACITLTDSGHGIAEHVLQKIFDPFFTTKPVGKGTGLGLAMAFGTIESHQGVIEVGSVVGKGTTFKIYLPISQR